MTERARRDVWLRRAGIGLAVVIVIAIGLTVAVFKTSLGLLDLGVDESLGSPAEGRAARARMQAAHGGLDRWRSHTWVELHASGHWPVAPARGAFGIDGMETELTLRFDPCDQGPFSMRLTDRERVFSGSLDQLNPDHVQLAIWTRRLFEMPFLLHDADIVHGLPGRSGVERAFFSWGQAQAQMGVEQYIVSLGPDGRLQGFDATVRLLAPFIEVNVTLDPSAEVEVEGLRLPGAITVYDPFLDGDLHRWRLKTVELGPRRSASDACPK